MAFIFLAERRRDRDSYDFLSLSTRAARGDLESVNKQLGSWEKEMD